MHTAETISAMLRIERPGLLNTGRMEASGDTTERGASVAAAEEEVMASDRSLISTGRSREADAVADDAAAWPKPRRFCQISINIAFS
jgi:hypothetical protein